MAPQSHEELSRYWARTLRPCRKGQTPCLGDNAEGKESLQCRRPGFDPWVRKIPWRREWLPTPVVLPGKPHGQRSLVGYSPWGRKELDATEWLTHFTESKHYGMRGYLKKMAYYILNRLLTFHWEAFGEYFLKHFLIENDYGIVSENAGYPSPSNPASSPALTGCVYLCVGVHVRALSTVQLFVTP